MSQFKRIKEFEKSLTFYNQYIIDSFIQDINGKYLHSSKHQDFSVVSSFVGIHVSWEQFLEQSFIGYLIGEKTANKKRIKRYINPVDQSHAQEIIIGTQKYVDWANPEIVIKLCLLYFESGNPFEIILKSIKNTLLDIRTIRNSCVHLSSTTSNAFNALASRLLNKTITNMKINDLLLNIDPSGNGTDTILDTYIDTIKVAANSISYP